ncbi:hypothetical protein ASPZODRAFT_17044 [Penicilliopsis zonata CBS 506.65]|uniref:Zn(2)-C6 fungal-type domain-containing protein n=1 Tax=Penicilliopsis zonata CBS 506.65 TaxID=1073090 RepID=A0A1L9SEL3_9EURO|nr:hypothetical protein ASPZODRAFT_17044 [Penicilliopsis zonata CBS 506.65]OJJ45592.1 hypothetical protein ASPZODRAFT_17044 [Penicilliopsis zonata CBS 506.65]
MSRQPKLRPKSHIPGFPDAIYDLSAGTAIYDFGTVHGPVEEKREQRVFRVKRKHVLKACDRCRVKKTKCDGKQPCNRCSTYNHPCLFRERKATQTKVYSRGFVEMLESHHLLVVKALQKLYRHCVNNEGFPGEPLVEVADGHPLTHAILDRLGLIKQAEESPDEPEDDTEDIRYLRLLSTSSSETSGTADASPEPSAPTTDPSPSIHPCQPMSSSVDRIHSWDWGLVTVNSEHCYHDHQEPHYRHMLFQQHKPTLESAPPPPPPPPPTAADMASPPEPAASSLPSHDPAYLYSLNPESNESPFRHHPPRLPFEAMVLPTPTSPVGMLTDYQSHSLQHYHHHHHHQQPQQHTFYTSSIDDGTGWDYAVI